MFKPPDWYFGSRWVFVFPRLGVVVKVPRVYWKKGWKGFVYWYKSEGLKCSLSLTEDELTGCRNLWTKGLRDNWKEFVFFIKYRKPFLQPTFFSLFGLVNIQKYGQIISRKKAREIKLHHQFWVLTEREFLDDSHHFVNSANFCISEDGHLRIVDYGSPATRTILLKWADKLEDVSLDPVQE